MGLILHDHVECAVKHKDELLPLMLQETRLFGAG
jgi:hypothetical protein